MAVCDICNHDMVTANGCVKHDYFLNNGKRVKPIIAGAEGWVEVGERCGDCGAKYGEYHHTGCDIERCPLCDDQFISCDCDYSDKIAIYVKEEQKPKRQPKTKKDYEAFLNGLETPNNDKKSNGGLIPDRSKYGTWLRKNDPTQFEVGFNEWKR